MGVHLEVEQTFAVTGRSTFVAARNLDPDALFTLPPGPTLGAVPIEGWFDIPRSLTPSGQPRTDLFVFKLVNESDRAKFEPGKKTLLE